MLQGILAFWGTKIIFVRQHWIASSRDYDLVFLFVFAKTLYMCNMAILYKETKWNNHRGQYTTQKSIKGSVLADHLAHQPVDDYQSLNFEFPDEDIMVWSVDLELTV